MELREALDAHIAAEKVIREKLGAHYEITVLTECRWAADSNGQIRQFHEELSNAIGGE